MELAKNLLQIPHARAGIRASREPLLPTVNPSVRSPWADARCWPAGVHPASGRLFFRIFQITGAAWGY